MLVQRLRTRGHVVEGADSGKEALERLTNARFDFLVLDLIMPKHSGIDVLNALAEQTNGGMRCIVMSGVAELWKKANPTVPVAGVLQKPFAFEELLKLIA